VSDESDREIEDATVGTVADVLDDTTQPHSSDIPAPAELDGVESGTGDVVRHGKHLRLADHRALSRAVAEGDAVCPLVFDPSSTAATDWRVTLVSGFSTRQSRV